MGHGAWGMEGVIDIESRGASLFAALVAYKHQPPIAVPHVLVPQISAEQQTTASGKTAGNLPISNPPAFYAACHDLT